MKVNEMLNKALKGKYMVPAFNFANFEILRGILLAIEETKSPVILQVSESAMNYFTDNLLTGIISSIRNIKTPIAIHLDHGKTFEVVKRAIDLGFDSVMIDGSMLSFKENVKLTKKVVDYAHRRGVDVEGELGVLSVSDDDGNLSDKERYTDPNMAKEFVLKTKVDSLAISIGTNHGVNKYLNDPQIRLDILKDIENAIPNVPLVLHGSSLVEAKYIDIINNSGGKITKAIGNENLFKDIHMTHLCKLNIDTDFRLAYTAGVREYMHDNPEAYCPREYGNHGIEFVKNCAIDRIVNICHSQRRQ